MFIRVRYKVVNFLVGIMKFRKQLTFLFVLSIISANSFVAGKQVETESSPYDLRISGLVYRPLNFTYSELQSFPMVSEVAIMKCVEGWTELYNWTGLPLFFLLSMTGVRAGATEVVFYASDGFSSSLTIERALHPTTLLALKANGTVLSHSNGYPYRLVVPCKYGYKWVKWITEIEVIDYDYKGTYESMGYSDEAEIPDCTFPSTTPPFETFHIVWGNTTHSNTTLSNATYYDLLDMYSQLQSKYDDLKSKHDTSVDALGTTRNLSYVFVMTTMIFIATTAYLATRKTKVKPDLEPT